MNQAAALNVLARHNVLLSGMHGKTRDDYIDGSSSQTLVNVHRALTVMPKMQNAHRFAVEIHAELARRAFSRKDSVAAQFMGASSK